jgi:hypothetical protein
MEKYVLPIELRRSGGCCCCLDGQWAMLSEIRPVELIPRLMEEDYITIVQRVNKIIAASNEEKQRSFWLGVFACGMRSRFVSTMYCCYERQSAEEIVKQAVQMLPRPEETRARGFEVAMHAQVSY